MINVTKSFLPPLEDYVDHLRRVWEAGWLTNRGELVRELEARLAAQLGVNNLLCVDNGTNALQIGIKALDLQGEIITTPFSYVASTSSIVWLGCKPVFVDIDPHHLTIDETLIEEKITEQTTGILAVHVYGNPCNVEAIKEIADRHGLKVIYDAAHCFGVDYRGESILNWGDVSIISFHATKLFHTAEGGGIVANSDALADRVRHAHEFGHCGPDAFYGLGINGKASELSAAMGLSVLPHVDEIISKRRTLSLAYDHFLALKSTRRPTMREECTYNYSYYPVMLPSERALLKTEERMNAKGVFPRRYFFPSLNTLPYVDYVEMPVAEDISRRILCLPLAYDLEVDDVEFITSLID